MFNEEAYLRTYPDVAAAVNAGSLSSGQQHYTLYGQFENRVGFFFGTPGNDTLTGFGSGTKLIAGVAFGALSNGSTVAGVGEVDTLIGTEGTDVFALGHPNLPQLTSPPQQFYVGGGNADYALIQNFGRLNDVVVLEGAPQNYRLQEVNGSSYISTASGDLVGIVEGIGQMSIVSSDSINTTRYNIPLALSGAFSVVVFSGVL